MSLDTLPIELIERIVLLLSYQDVINYCQSSGSNICDDESFWRRKLIHDFGEDSLEFFRDSWKATYLTSLYSPVNMPEELQERIMLDTRYPELLDLCRTNRGFARICRDDLFWYRKLIHDFGEDAVRYRTYSWNRDSHGPHWYTQARTHPDWRSTYADAYDKIYSKIDECTPGLKYYYNLERCMRIKLRQGKPEDADYFYRKGQNYLPDMIYDSIEADDHDTISGFLDIFPYPIDDLIRIIKYSYRRNHPDVANPLINYLFNKHPIINGDDSQALLNAISIGGDIEVFEYVSRILGTGDKLQLLSSAASAGRTEFINYLLDRFSYDRDMLTVSLAEIIKSYVVVKRDDLDIFYDSLEPKVNLEKLYNLLINGDYPFKLLAVKYFVDKNLDHMDRSKINGFINLAIESGSAAILDLINEYKPDLQALESSIIQHDRYDLYKSLNMTDSPEYQLRRIIKRFRSLHDLLELDRILDRHPRNLDKMLIYALNRISPDIVINRLLDRNPTNTADALISALNAEYSLPIINRLVEISRQNGSLDQNLLDKAITAAVEVERMDPDVIRYLISQGASRDVAIEAAADNVDELMEILR